MGIYDFYVEDSKLRRAVAEQLYSRIIETIGYTPSRHDPTSLGGACAIFGESADQSVLRILYRTDELTPGDNGKNFFICAPDVADCDLVDIVASTLRDLGIEDDNSNL